MNLELLREMVRRSRYLLAALLMVALLDAGLYAYRTFFQEPALERAQTAYTSSRSSGGGSSRRYADYQASLRDLDQFQGRLIAKKDFAAFLDSLFSLAEKHSLTLKGISYKPGTEKGPVVSYGMTLQVNGKYPNLKVLLADLERYPQMVAVEQLSFRNGSPTQESVDLQLQIIAFLKTEGA